jgi:hypothetical protein
MGDLRRFQRNVNGKVTAGDAMVYRQMVQRNDATRADLERAIDELGAKLGKRIDVESAARKEDLDAVYAYIEDEGAFQDERINETITHQIKAAVRAFAEWCLTVRAAVVAMFTKDGAA